MRCLLLLAQVFIFSLNNVNAERTDEIISVKKCIVNGTTYLHSQTGHTTNRWTLTKGWTVSSRDPNCHCLCVAGDVYCWWENYKARMISSNESTDLLSEIQLSEPVFVDRVEVKENENQGIKGVEKNVTFTQRVTCFVMGKEYKVGEILPHSTGNCVECSCGREGRVECSPRDCVALRPPGQISVVSSSLDHEMPDNQIELFGISRERGIDENF